MMILKLRYWNLRFGSLMFPTLFILGVVSLYIEYGVFAFICGMILRSTIGKTVLDVIEIISSDVKRQMN